MRFNCPTCSHFRGQKIFVILLTLALAALPLTADSKSSSWVLAAAPFSGNSDLTELLPSLILSSLPDNLLRSIDADEQREYQRIAIKKQLPSLVTDMNSLIAKRDSVVLGSDSLRDRNQKTAEFDSQIDEARKKIEDCLSFAGLETFQPEEELWKNLELYKGANGSVLKLTGEETDEELALRAASDNFQGLLQGTIIERGNYLYAAVTVTRFPGNRIIGSCESVYPKTEANLLADDIAQSLLDVLVNKAPVTLNFVMDNAVNKVTVRLDGVPLVNYAHPVSTQSGVHHITIESEGCESQSFTYDFSDYPAYDIQVRMVPQVNVELNLTAVTDNRLAQRLIHGGAVPESGDSRVYLMGGFSSPSGTSVLVNGLPVLGEVVSDNGISTFFIVEEGKPHGAGTANIVSGTVNLRTGSTSEIIDVRRRAMYRAFGMFLLTLPVTFGAYGRMNDYAAVLDGRYNQVSVPENKTLWSGYQKWRGYSTICMTVSLGFAVNWGYQLSRYILAANQVLPEIVYPDEIE